MLSEDEDKGRDDDLRRGYPDFNLKLDDILQFDVEDDGSIFIDYTISETDQFTFFMDDQGVVSFNYTLEENGKI